MKWHRGIPFLFALTIAIVAAEEMPAESHSKTLNLSKWRQPAYDDLLRSYKLDENKTNPYTTSQRFRVYAVPDDEKLFVSGSWKHPNYERIRKKDRETSKRKENDTAHDVLNGLKLTGLVTAAAVAEVAANSVVDDDGDMLKADKHGPKPKHKAGRH